MEGVDGMVTNKTISGLLKIARSIVSANAETEAQRLLFAVIPDSPLRNKCHAVGGFVRDEVLGIESKDLDVVVEKEGGAEEITKYLHRLFPNQTSSPHRLGASYPIWQIDFKDSVVYKGKGYNTAGAEVQFADTQN